MIKNRGMRGEVRRALSGTSHWTLHGRAAPRLAAGSRVADARSARDASVPAHRATRVRGRDRALALVSFLSALARAGLGIDWAPVVIDANGLAQALHVGLDAINR
jgi:predicted acyltransferase